MLIKILSSIAVILIVNIVFALIANTKDKNNEDNTIRLPKAYAGIGIVCDVFFVFLIIIEIFNATDKIELAVFIIEFSVFTLMGVYLILGYLNWRIRFYDDTFEYRTALRHTLRFKYSDVTKSRRTKSGAFFIKARNKLLIIDPYAVGMKNEFLETLYIKMGHEKITKSKRKKKAQKKQKIKQF